MIKSIFNDYNFKFNFRISEKPMRKDKKTLFFFLLIIIIIILFFDTNILIVIVLPFLK